MPAADGCGGNGAINPALTDDSSLTTYTTGSSVMRIASKYAAQELEGTRLLDEEDASAGRDLGKYLAMLLRRNPVR
jgi:hypothetical protein